ncbi:MAG TPA: hypothetical protein VF796_01805, partial [Humisphaera sp.]
MSPTDLGFSCSACGQGFDAPPDYIARYGGQNINCPVCDAVVVVPLAGATAVPLEYLGPSQVESDGVWRDGGLLVVLGRATFPQRCCLCNADAPGKPVRMRLRGYLSDDPMPGNDVQMTVWPHLCGWHAGWRRWARIIGLGLLPGGVAGLVWGNDLGAHRAAAPAAAKTIELVGLCCAIAGGLLALISAVRPLSLVSVSRGVARIDGCGH